ncbi:hypothetical protein L596_006961 [Steinernema carpocapsae]|uniref:G-protein coupled receptors family 1 profile domain-containing protein n=1 Tax=Steinernema carpocapsae TaxID=34508 RepID=A0A4U5P8S6_STECR|nr:hypothetical protein L596_006961 [Steinernema carpocapsae]
MLTSGASAQFSIIALVALACSVILALVIVTVSLTVIRDSSSLLALLLVSMFLNVTVHVPDSLMWVSLMNREEDRTQLAINLLYYWGTVIHCLTTFYDICTIAILAKKSLNLAFPNRDSKRDVRTILIGLALVSVTIISLIVLADVFSEIARISSLDCSSRDCLYGKWSIGSAFFTATKLVITAFFVALGIWFLVLSHKRRSSVGVAFERSVNRFVKCLFLLRLFFESIPFLLDIVLSRIINLEVAESIGPYQRFGIVIDTFLIAMIFYVLLGQKNAYNLTTRVQSTFTLEKRSNISPNMGMFRNSITKL